VLLRQLRLWQRLLPQRRLRSLGSLDRHVRSWLRLLRAIVLLRTELLLRAVLLLRTELRLLLQQRLLRLGSLGSPLRHVQEQRLRLLLRTELLLRTVMLLR
jgi:hypothetical protein